MESVGFGIRVGTEFQPAVPAGDAASGWERDSWTVGEIGSGFTGVGGTWCGQVMPGDNVKVTVDLMAPVALEKVSRAHGGVRLRDA